ncbi:ribonuclease T2 [Staphylotrichum tortipilum]|uniref:Ribonuclease T2 n=1 Tax=Staphylotrichum tortipilum TaxID=2831512 RepID=A0AAN6MCG9_9PEZI|nr:ribonuclease T2 [Staphylotrichum longicolle]
MAPSLRAILSYASGFVSQLPLLGSGSVRHVSPYEPLSAAPPCPLDGPVSCSNSTPVAGDPCCFVHPEGRIVLTQVWDAEVHVLGAEEDWMLQGLWPDRCDGTASSQPSSPIPQQYTNTTAILRHHGQDDLLEFIRRYWLTSSPNGPPPIPQINTLSPVCYPYHPPGLEVIDYLARAASLFRTLDTYRALTRANILPREGATYPLARVREALERVSGGRVVLKCVDGTGDGGKGDVLREVGYVYFVRGSFQRGEFVPAQERQGDGGDCAEVVRYLPKRRRRGL